MSQLNKNEELVNNSEMENVSDVSSNISTTADINANKLSPASAAKLQKAEKSKAFFDKLNADRHKRFEYLMKQTQIFTHFMTKDAKDDDTKKPQQTKTKRKAADLAKAQSASKKSKVAEEVSSKFTSNPPYIKNGEMRDYQLDGLNWLITLEENGVNGILADEMGLGKTLQTISLLGYMKHYKKQNGPFLIIVPLSTLDNWLNECKRWCPSLQIFCFYGSFKARRRNVHADLRNTKWDVCITTYETCAADIFQLSSIKWYYVIIDEGHRIKNEKTILAKSCRRLKSINRLLITGTPLQNNLHELWALLNFLLPDVFNSAEDFDEWFNMSNCMDNTEIVERLHAVLKPFLLRRIKAEVEKSLLPKKEVKIYVGMSRMQTELYKRILLKDIGNLNKPGCISLNNIHQKLRECTNHPYMFEGCEPGPPYTTDTHIVANSGKLSVLDKLLPKLKEQGSRVLIFAQYLRMFDILEDYFNWRQYKYHVLKGDHSNEERIERINEFNAEGSQTFIFLLSTRAGGLGINLATADVVIFYDSDWNPQMDLQAMDRAHRIGQKKQVRIFRLITEGTIDEILDDCAERKLRLDKNVIQNGFTKAPKSEDLLSILRYNTNQIFSSKNVDLSNDDIDTILLRGEAKTAEKVAKFTALADNAPEDNKQHKEAKWYDFEGEKYGQTKERYDFQFMPSTSLQRKSVSPDGFKDWTRANYEQFIAANIKYGRYAMDKILNAVNGKTPFDVICYSQVFWLRCNEIEGIDKILPQIRGAYNDLPEDLADQKLNEKNLLESKYKLYKNPLRDMVIVYDEDDDDNGADDTDTENNINKNNISGNNKFTQEEDRFLICKSHEIGFDQYDVFEQIQNSIRLSSLPKDCYARVCTVEELEKRCKKLISLLKLEAEKLQHEEDKRKMLQQNRRNLRPRRNNVFNVFS